MSSLAEVMTILMTLAFLILVVIFLTHRHSSPLAKYPSFALFASWSDLTYILFDIFHPLGPLSTIDLAHAQFGSIIRLGPNRVHLLKPSNKVLSSLGRLEKSHSYAAFDLNGHQSLFSERNNRLHRNRGNLSRCFNTANIEAKMDVINKNVEKVICLIQSRIDTSSKEEEGTTINLLGIMQAFGIDVASEFLYGCSYKALEELQLDKEKEMPSVAIFNYDFVSSLTVLLGSTSWSLIRWCDWLYKRIDFRSKNPHSQQGAKVISFASQIVKLHLSRIDKGAVAQDGDYLSILMQSDYYKEKKGKELEEALALEVTDVLFASADTVAHVLSAGLVELYGAGSDSVQYIQADETDCQSLVSDVVETFLRFASVNPRSLDRVVGLQGLVLDDGNILPSGVIVGVSPAAFHRSILGEGSNPFVKYNDIPRHIEFGYPGSRACVAKQLARSEMQAMTKSFIKSFNIVDANKVKVDQLDLVRDRWTASLPNGRLVIKVEQK